METFSDTFKNEHVLNLLYRMASKTLSETRSQSEIVFVYVLL